MTPYSYLKTKFFAIFALAFVFSTFASAQYGRSSEPVLRGTAVLETAPEGWRLVPVCIYSSGKFYDAGYYQSTPVPMSLINGTIYDIQKAGMPIGTFSVDDAIRVGAAWYGRGKYTNFADTAAQRERNTAAASGTVQLKDSGPDDRPVLKRSKPQPEQTAQAETPKPDDAKIANEDPNRPILKRGTQAPPASLSGPPEDPQAKAETARRSRQMIVAVSDPSQRASRPFDYNWEDQQKQQLTEAMTKLAAAELTKVARARGLTLAPKDKIEFAETWIRAYDVDYSNNPQVIFIAKFIPSMRQLSGISKEAADEVLRGSIYVTSVGRVNYNGEVERIFGEVSDPRDLNTYPRMEFVDAVDVDSDNRAELLFVKDNEAGRRFVIYRLYGLQMNELFTSGAR